MVYEDGVQQGPWNDDEHKKYLMFLNFHLANKDSKGKKNGQKYTHLYTGRKNCSNLCLSLLEREICSNAGPTTKSWNSNIQP